MPNVVSLPLPSSSYPIPTPPVMRCSDATTNADSNPARKSKFRSPSKSFLSQSHLSTEKPVSSEAAAVEVVVLVTVGCVLTLS